MIKLKTLVKEQEESQIDSQLDQAMQNGLTAMASNFSANKEELKQDVEQADIPIAESLTAVTIVGALLAAPKIVELLGKGFIKLISVFRKLIKPGQAKTSEGEEAAAEALVHFTHKWHGAYIKGIKGLLKITGLFSKAGIKDDAAQTKAAELIFYTIVAGLAVYSGFGAAAAFKKAIAAKNIAASAGNFSLGSFEAAMAQIKTGEVKDFVGKLGLKLA
jgi:hypothetical protein